MSDHKFELEKAVQAVNYIIHKLDLSHINKLDALKIIFLADRYHLRKYGRMITNDEYWAMTYGPVASSVKDVVQLGDYLSLKEQRYASRYLNRYKKHQLKSVAETDLDVLSESDQEALDVAVEQCKKHHDLVGFTHLFPEWQKHETSIQCLNQRVKMDMLDCFETAPAEAEYCDVPDDILCLNKKHYCDTLAFNQMWG